MWKNKSQYNHFIQRFLYVYICLKVIHINTNLEVSAKHIKKKMYFKAFEELKLPGWKIASRSS